MHVIAATRLRCLSFRLLRQHALVKGKEIKNTADNMEACQFLFANYYLPSEMTEVALLRVSFKVHLIPLFTLSMSAWSITTNFAPRRSCRHLHEHLLAAPSQSRICASSLLYIQRGRVDLLYPSSEPAVCLQSCSTIENCLHGSVRVSPHLQGECKVCTINADIEIEGQGQILAPFGIGGLHEVLTRDTRQISMHSTDELRIRRVVHDWRCRSHICVERDFVA